MGAEARELGSGGARIVAQAVGVAGDTVRRPLKEAGYSLQANAKTSEGGQHPDRDAQIAYLADQASEHLAAGQPVVSVDAKKKELVGQFKNGGRDYRPARSPLPVNVYDFLDPALGKAIPYGVYNLGANSGWVWGLRPPHSSVSGGDAAQLVGPRGRHRGPASGTRSITGCSPTSP